MNDNKDSKDSKRRGPGVEEGAMGNDLTGEPIENIKSESVEHDTDTSRKTRAGVRQA